MKTINLLLCAVFIAFAVNAKNQSKSATININATVPSGTDKVWIVGDFVNWDITKAIEGTKNTDGTFSFSIPTTNSIEYRLYNLNDWNFPEVGENNPTIELPNRKADYLADSNFNITVWGWKQTGINPQIKSTYPIIFVHGLNSDNYAWQSNNFLEDLPQIFNLHGLAYGGDLNVTLDYDRSSLMNTKQIDVHLFDNGLIFGDYYKINFNTRFDGTHGDKPNDAILQVQGISKTDLSFMVQNPSRYKVGDILCIDNEYMIVESISSPIINVSRGKFESQIVEHTQYSTIWNLSLESNQASIAKQGWGLKLAIDSVKKLTKSKKVILVGHSMGGLAIREYLKTYYNNDVAKVVTIGTPHLGSTVAELSNTINGLVGIDGRSDAIRDLSYNYNNNLNANYLGEDPVPPYGDSPDDGCFLFGGNESNIPKDFHNADVNANGVIDVSNVSGINIDSNTNFPPGISYTWIVSQWGNTVNGDGCVRLNRQFPWFKKENGSPLIEVGDTIKTNKFHTDEPTDYYTLLRGLDEPSTPDLAYEIGCNNDITGYITLQKESLNVDVDLYKLCLVSEGFLNVSINASNLSGVKGIAILDSNQQILFTTSTTDFPVNFTYHTIPGTYYIRVRGIATTDSYKYPYTLSTNYSSKLKLKYPIGSESLNVGSTATIQWENSNLISNIKIEYSTNGGTDWYIITSSFPTTSGSYSWLVPTKISNNCKIRITDISNPVISVVNDKVFSIVDLRPNGITTTLPSTITATTAISGGNIISDAGATITVRGVCWNTTGNPTIDDNKTIDGTGIGSFSSNLSGLLPNTTYYVKAYATNNAGTAYGSEINFTTTSVTDIDGNIYHTVTIGAQVWLVENLKTTKYRNGELINNTNDDALWSSLTTGAYCEQNKDPYNTAIYGKLYNWYAITDDRKITPIGWHIPTYSELNNLVNYLGGSNIAGGKLKSTGQAQWINPNTGATNESGFTAFPGGNRWGFGSLSGIGYNGFWWSSSLGKTPNNLDVCYYLKLYNNFSNADILSNSSDNAKNYGCSVRCIKNTAPIISTSVSNNVTTNSAKCGGNISFDGGETIISRGVCWNTIGNPTISDNKTSDGSGSGIFTSSISNLSPNTKYYVRAYATNIGYTVYGDEISFSTSPLISENTVTDIDGNIYNTIKIGNQLWMVENLKVTRYRNGDLIPKITDNTVWGTLTNGAYCEINNSKESSDIYGNLYNWYAVSDNRNIAPSGWHIPSDSEWDILTSYLGGSSVSGGKLKETGTLHWSSPNTGATNEIGFTALPSGSRDQFSFSALGTCALFWSSTGYENTAWYRVVYHISNIVNRLNYVKYLGLSVRCVSDYLITNTDYNSSNLSFKVYPNPISDQLIIEMKGNSDKKEIKILNSLGQIIYVGSVYEKEVVSMKDMPKGIYLIRIGNDKSFETKKILKK